MAKKQNPSILSPENYIRQRARNLPIYKCYINEGWSQDGLSHITIARKHINDNITFCIYLVDLKCLGVKDTYYRFNIPEEEFYDFMAQAGRGFKVVEADYVLVHNIIHAGWEFAEGIGFEPHKDFLSVTQHMLEEDTDDIPIMDIHCGDEDGKPLFIQGPLESNAEADRIVKELRKNVGEKNFNYILAEDDPSFEDSDDEDYYDDQYSDFRLDYEENSYEENVRLFLELSQFIEEEDSDFDNDENADEDEEDTNFIKLEALSDILFEEIVDDDEVDNWISRWNDDGIMSYDACYAMLGLPRKEMVSQDDIDFVSSTRDPEVLIPYVRERWGDTPFIDYLRIQDVQFSREWPTKISQALKKYPNYGLLKIEERIAQLWTDTSGFIPEDFLYSAFFGEREEITPMEYAKLQYVRAIYFLNTNNYDGIEALYSYNSCDFEDLDKYGDIDTFNAFLLASRVSKLKLYLLDQRETGF